jgi:translation initiation factor IF-1
MAKKHNRQSESQVDDRDDRLEFSGVIEEALPGTLFKVRCDNNLLVLCTLAGKLRMNHIRVLPGDAVQVCVSPYDTTRGRITYRLR